MSETAKKPRKPRAPKKAVMPPEAAVEVFDCSFCKKTFKSESRYVSHSCEKKKRWLMRDERYIRIAFSAFQAFYKLSLRVKKPKEYQDFIDSRFFLDFVRFGRYVEHINAIEANGFVEFLIKADIKLTDWQNPTWYESWIREVSRKETPQNAIRRNMLLMDQWAKDYDENMVDFFRKVPTPLAVDWIRRGRISPYLLYCGVGNPLFERLSDEQLGMVKEFINPLFWKDQIAKHKEEVDQIRLILEEAGF